MASWFARNEPRLEIDVARAVKLNNADEWIIVTTVVAAARSAGRQTAGSPEVIPPAFLAPEVSVERVMDVTPTLKPRAAGVPMVDLSVVPEADERYTLAIRHLSGALTFHGADLETEQPREGSAAATRFRFRVTLRRGGAVSDRPGVVGAAVKLILLKVSRKILDALLPSLAAEAESALWKIAGLSEGWFKLDEASLRSGKLQRGAPSGPGPSNRTLLFLHGALSDAASAFKGLVDTQFFAQLRPLYGEEMYALNHFTVSKTPEENARDLLAGLPNREISFDVITHSRGGLVLRTLVERKSALGAIASRFKLRHGVLVASPNDGTALATPNRWESMVGWFANLLELFPDGPLTFGAGFVANAIVWIAQRAAGALPGIASMDAAGDTIAELQAPPPPPASGYSALVSNFTPTGNILERMADVGIDAFFGNANDLVVPSAGGWLTDRAEGPLFIAPERIGCFGAGGNFPSRVPEVNHLNFFGRAETATFLVQALNGTPHGLSRIDPSLPLPDSWSRRSGATAIAAVAPPIAPSV
jgi:hypothetical protein